VKYLIMMSLVGFSSLMAFGAGKDQDLLVGMKFCGSDRCVEFAEDYEALFSSVSENGEGVWLNYFERNLDQPLGWAHSLVKAIYIQDQDDNISAIYQLRLDGSGYYLRDAVNQQDYRLTNPQPGPCNLDPISCM
jgi:hypothetical protein